MIVEITRKKLKKAKPKTNHQTKNTRSITAIRT